MAAGLAAFVQGYFGARDRQMAIADKKADRERQKKLDELVFSREARAAELHDLQVGETRRAITERERDREILRSGADAAQAAMDADQAAARAPDPVTGVAAELGLPLGAVTNRAADTFVANNPLPSTPAVARPGPTVAAASALPQVTRASEYPPGRGPAPQAPAAPQRAPMGATPTQSQAYDDAGLITLPDGTVIAPAPRGAIADELGAYGPAGVRYLRGPRDTREADYPPSRAPAAPEAAPRNPMLTPGINPLLGGTLNIMAARRGTGRGAVPAPDAISDMIGTEDLAAAGEKLLGKPAPGPRVDALSPADQKADKQARTAMGAARVVEQTASPETQGAAQAAVTAAATPAPGKGGKGLKPGETVTPAQKERASRAFLDYYAENGVPKIIEGYLKRGEIDKAIAFQNFMDSQTTKAGMKDWALATFALTTGDLDGFADRLMDSYNRNNYINDSTIVLKDQSEIFRDSSGNVTGARVVFKDEASGNTFDQVFSSQDDLIAFGMLNFDPATVFENYVARAEAAKGNAKGALDTRKTEAEIAKLEADARKADAEAAATPRLGAVAGVPDTGVSGGPPVAYRP